MIELPKMAGILIELCMITNKYADKPLNSNWKQTYFGSKLFQKRTSLWQQISSLQSHQGF